MTGVVCCRSAVGLEQSSARVLGWGWTVPLPCCACPRNCCWKAFLVQRHSSLLVGPGLAPAPSVLEPRPDQHSLPRSWCLSKPVAVVSANPMCTFHDKIQTGLVCPPKEALAAGSCAWLVWLPRGGVMPRLLAAVLGRCSCQGRCDALWLLAAHVHGIEPGGPCRVQTLAKHIPAHGTWRSLEGHQLLPWQSKFQPLGPGHEMHKLSPWLCAAQVVHFALRTVQFTCTERAACGPVWHVPRCLCSNTQLVQLPFCSSLPCKHRHSQACLPPFMLPICSALPALRLL